MSPDSTPKQISPESTPQIRRVVMGEPSPGDSTFTHVQEVGPTIPAGPGAQYYVWGFDEVPTLPWCSEDDYEMRSHFPAPGGARVVASYFSNPTPHRSPAEVERVLANERAGHAAGSRDGMHRTDTIDIGVVVKGRLTVEGEDGTAVTMGQGDVYVQNGTQHRWLPDADDPPLVVFVILGAERESPESAD